MRLAVFMLFGVTALLSMWISNTATAAMMMPLDGLSKVDGKTAIRPMCLCSSVLPIAPALAEWRPSQYAIAAAEVGLSFFDWMNRTGNGLLPVDSAARP
jgi:sodium-dependent dicarboxylate transporter 2/3/5